MALKKQHTGEISDSKTTLHGRRVSFFASVKVRICLHVNDYTQDEVHACWYNHEEREAMQENARVAAKLVLGGKLRQDTKEFCRRGVEFATLAHKVRRQQLRQKAWFAVFDKQQAQYEIGKPNEPELIAQAYKEASLEASSHAIELALKDQREVGIMSPQ